MTARHNTLALFAALAAALAALLTGATAQAGDRVVVGSRLVVPGIGIRHSGHYSRFVFGAPINAYTLWPQPYLYVSSPLDVAPPPPPPPRFRHHGYGRFPNDRYDNNRFHNGPPRFAPNPYRNRYYYDRPYGSRHYDTWRYYDRSTGDFYIERRVPLRERRDVYKEKRIPLRERDRR